MKKIYFLLVALFVFTALSAQIVNIPDPVFKSLLLAASPTNHVGSTVNPNSSNNPGVYTTIDTNQDGEIQVSEAQAIIYLGMVGTEITSIEGIEAFTNLQYLICSFNTQLHHANLTSCMQLKTAFFESSALTSINVTGLTSLRSLNCSYNDLTSIDVTTLTSLQSLSLSENEFSELDLSHQTQLTSLRVLGNNNLTSLSVSNNAMLEDLWASGDQLHSVNLVNLPRLYKIFIKGTFTSLDLSGCAFQPPLQYGTVFDVNCSNSPNLTHINVKNGYRNPNVSMSTRNITMSQQFICYDDGETLSANSFNANSLLSTYCNFTPGNNYNTVLGNVTYDADNNGCGTSDSGIKNIRMAISDGTNSGSTHTVANGNYAFFTQQSNVTFNPVLENQYFNISPAQAVLNFPLNNNTTQSQDFCITPIGIHNDMKVTVIPIEQVMSGFDSAYKIIYQNKGTHAQSGAISVTFNDAVMDLVSSNPAVSSQGVNYLNWNFTDLLPFETRTILLTLNANSPMETPPLNGGDILNFTASVNNTVTDETPEDNTFTLNQTVVNSFDPNDKTCLEGNTVTPEMIGKYVHYMIRFENTGTANARNIVVKDMIDTTKFDISSLVPIDGSHPFVTKISNTNKVEFIFENIQLPFDDANNDGYVAFKIKTKPTLVLGDTFSNTAGIYFDYNFPIVTNTATTTIALLANQDFEFEDYFKIYPVPVTTVLNIDSKKSIEVSSISIYNTLGQLVLVVPSAQQIKSVDVSSLKSGNYFVKINTGKGSATAMFVKL